MHCSWGLCQSVPVASLLMVVRTYEQVTLIIRTSISPQQGIGSMHGTLNHINSTTPSSTTSPKHCIPACSDVMLSQLCAGLQRNPLPGECYLHVSPLSTLSTLMLHTRVLSLQECAFIQMVNDVQYTVKPGFVPMRVPGTFYVNAQLKDLLFEELQQSVQRGEVR